MVEEALRKQQIQWKPGIENVVSVGMIGGYSKLINVGDIIIPPLVYSEEGTSLHYFENKKYYKPNEKLFKMAIEFVKNCKQYPIVSTEEICDNKDKKMHLEVQNENVYNA